MANSTLHEQALSLGRDYSFVHDLYRCCAQTGLDASEMHTLHALVLGLHSDQGPIPLHPSRLFAHAQQMYHCSTNSIEIAEAKAALDEQYEQAWSRCARFRDVEEICRVSSAYVDCLDSVEERLREEVRLADKLCDWGEFRRAGELSEETVKALGSSVSPRLQAEVRLTFARIALRRGDYESAKRETDLAIPSFKSVECGRGFARCTALLSEIETDAGNLEKALELAEEAERLFRRLGDLRQVIMRVAHQAGILRMLGRLEDALDYFREIDELVQVDGCELVLVRNHGNRANTLLDLGHIALAMTEFDTALSIASRLGDRHGVLVTRMNRANAFETQGRLDEAVQEYRVLEPEIEESGDMRMLSRLHGNWAVVCILKKDFPTALELLQRSADISTELNDIDQLAYVHSNRATIFGWQGDCVAALAEYEAATAILRRTGQSVELGVELVNVADTLCSLGQYEEALGRAQESVECLDQVGARASVWYFRCLAVLVRAETALGGIENAKMLAKDALSLADALNVQANTYDPHIEGPMKALRRAATAQEPLS